MPPPERLGLDYTSTGSPARSPTQSGTLDILAKAKITVSFAAIELKHDNSHDEVFGQINRYTGWVSENLIQMDGVPVCAIIIVAEITPKLEAVAKTNPNLYLVENVVKFELTPKD